MGRRGPPPTPTPLRVLRGNPGRRPIPEEVTPHHGRPRRPEWLTGDAAVEWKRVVPELERLGLLVLIDRAALAVYCQAYGRMVEAERMITKEGAVVIDRHLREVVSPHVTIAQKAGDQMRRLAVEFGMTPSARTRMASPPPKVKDADPFEEWVNRGTGTE